MKDDDRIGKQVVRVRERDDEVITLYHLVETFVMGNPIVRCGRRLLPRLGTRLEYTVIERTVADDDDCTVCWPTS